MENIDERLKRQMAFALEIDKEKNIFRQTHLSGHGRNENDAEHAWHMAIMAYLLREYANEQVDIGRVMLMCLIHDIVEIDAGDTYAYDEEGLATQKMREDAAKERIFSILPEDQKEELTALFDEFEEYETPESRFAHSLDNLQPLMLNDSNGGGDWREHRVRASQVYGRQGKTRLGSEKLFQYTDALLRKNILEGNITDDMDIPGEDSSYQEALEKPEKKTGENKRTEKETAGDLTGEKHSAVRQGAADSIGELFDTVARLRAPDGCPWDRAQTHDSLKAACVEEASEVICGINILSRTGRTESLREELGDLLLQVVMHAQIAEEEGLFTLDDVIRGINDKMIRRHPHVFSDNQEKADWKQIKAMEKKGREWEEPFLFEAFDESEKLIGVARRRKQEKTIHDESMMNPEEKT